MFQLAVCSEMCPGFLTDNLPKFANFMTVVSAVMRHFFNQLHFRRNSKNYCHS